MTVHDRLSGPRYRLTVDDYAHLAEIGAFAGHRRTELIDGIVYTMSPQYRPHWRIKNELSRRIDRRLNEIGSDLYVGTEGSVRLSSHDMPEPDIIVTAEPDGDGAIPGESVRLLIEVASTTVTADLGEMARLYAEAGIPEYWVIDVGGRMVHQLWQAESPGYREQIQVKFGDPITAVMIHNLTIDTDKL